MRSAAVQATTEERDRFVAAFVRAQRRATFALVIGTIVVIISLALLSPSSNGHVSDTRIYWAVGATCGLFAILWHWIGTPGAHAEGTVPCWRWSDPSGNSTGDPGPYDLNAISDRLRGSRLRLVAHSRRPRSAVRLVEAMGRRWRLSDQTFGIAGFPQTARGRQLTESGARSHRAPR